MDSPGSFAEGQLEEWSGRVGEGFGEKKENIYMKNCKWKENAYSETGMKTWTCTHEKKKDLHPEAETSKAPSLFRRWKERRGVKTYHCKSDKEKLIHAHWKIR